MPRQRARRDEPAPGLDSLILRGYPMTQDVLRSNAQDNYDIYGFYGISVFRADTAEEVDTVFATKLRALAKIAHRLAWFRDGCRTTSSTNELGPTALRCSAGTGRNGP